VIEGAMTSDGEDPGPKAGFVAFEAGQSLADPQPRLGSQVLLDRPGRDPEVAQQRRLEIAPEPGEARVVSAASLLEDRAELRSEHGSYRRTLARSPPRVKPDSRVLRQVLVVR